MKMPFLSETQIAFSDIRITCCHVMTDVVRKFAIPVASFIAGYLFRAITARRVRSLLFHSIYTMDME